MDPRDHSIFFLLKDAPTALKTPASLSNPKAHTAQQMPSPEAGGPSTEGAGKRVMEVILYPLSPNLACGQVAILKSSRILPVCKDL